MKEYSARWSLALILTSTVFTGVCVAVARYAWVREASGSWQALAAWPILDPIGIIVGTACFTIRGYSIGPDAIWVHRLLWKTRLPRLGLLCSSYEPGVMRWSLRAFGNGGFFSVSGLYWNKFLGLYRAFVTDGRRTVVLRYPHRTIVLSPANPEQFVADLSCRVPTA